MRAYEPQSGIYLHKYHAVKQPKTYIEYINESDYSPSYKKYIIDYYNYYLNLHNLETSDQHKQTRFERELARM